MTDSEQVGISIVLFEPNPDQYDWTIQAVRRQTIRPFRLQVHLNAGTLEAAESLRGSVADAGEITWSSQNLGYAGGHNKNLATLFSCGASHVAVLNPDLALAPDALSLLVRLCESRHNRVIAGPVLMLADPDTHEPEQLVDSMGIRWTATGRHLDDRHGSNARIPSAAQRVSGISGACLVVPRAVWDELVRRSGEFFDEDFIAYREDAELAFRASILGIESWLEPRARGLHVRGLRGTSRSTSAWVNRLGVRNRFLIAAKYGVRRPGVWPLPWIRDLVVVLGVILTERESLPALAEAWRLRQRMRAKGKLVRRARAEAP